MGLACLVITAPSSYMCITVPTNIYKTRYYSHITTGILEVTMSSNEIHMGFSEFQHMLYLLRFA